MSHPDAPPDVKAEIRRQLGLDQPLLEQWGTYVWGLGTAGDFGETLISRASVNSILASRLPPTLSLVAGGFA